MITPDEVRAIAKRRYLSFLQAFLRDEAFFPLEIPFAKVKTFDDYAATRAAVDTLLKGAKAARGYGYSLELKTRNTRRYGAQSLPSRIHFESEGDFLKLIGKGSEFADFKEAVGRIKAALPQLSGWLRGHPKEVLRHLGKWPELLKVCRYFLEHPAPQLYVRELPISVHSKFVEENKGILRQLLDVLLPPSHVNEAETDFERRFLLKGKEALVRFRVLDEHLLTRYSLPVSDLSVPISQFNALELAGCRFVVAENEMTFLTLPELTDGVGLFGAGFRVEALKSVSWLAGCPIFYWGDLDVQGFQILSQLRSYFPNTVSVMMDAKTLARFEDFVVPGTLSGVTQLPNLNPEEAQVFAALAKDNVRLEQERISHEYAVRELRRVCRI